MTLTFFKWSCGHATSIEQVGTGSYWCFAQEHDGCREVVEIPRIQCFQFTEVGRMEICHEIR